MARRIRTQTFLHDACLNSSHIIYSFVQNIKYLLVINLRVFSVHTLFSEYSMIFQVHTLLTHLCLYGFNYRMCWSNLSSPLLLSSGFAVTAVLTAQRSGLLQTTVIAPVTSRSGTTASARKAWGTKCWKPPGMLLSPSYSTSVHTRTSGESYNRRITTQSPDCLYCNTTCTCGYLFITQFFCLSTHHFY